MIVLLICTQIIFLLAGVALLSISSVRRFFFFFFPLGAAALNETLPLVFNLWQIFLMFSRI